MHFQFDYLRSVMLLLTEWEVSANDFRAIPRESPNTILTNTYVVGSKANRQAS